MILRTTALACLVLAPSFAWAQQSDARAAAEILKRDNLVETYCGDNASEPLPGFTEEATDEACDMVSSEDDD